MEIRKRKKERIRLMQKVKQKVSSLLLIVMMIVQLLTPFSVNAAAPADMSATKTMGDMLQFFQGGEVASLKGITKKEAQVYSVFLSNFYKPGVTRLKDLNGASTLVEQVQGVFFKEASQAESQLIELNKVVYTSIKTGIEASIRADESNILYKDQEEGHYLTGEDLILKIAGVTDRKIYYGGGKKLSMDLGSSSMQAAFKTLVMYSVEYMLGDTGVRTYTRMYIDRFGNIWGAKEEGESDDVVLVMPACLNPLAFEHGAKAQEEMKVPMANAFVLGAIAQTSELKSSFEIEDVPLYNIGAEYRGSGDKNNLMNIIGVLSPYKEVLDSNNLLQSTQSPAQLLKEFYSRGYLGVAQGRSSLIYSINMRNIGTVEKVMQESTLSKELKQTIIERIVTPLKVDLQDTRATMYYLTDVAEGSLDEWEQSLSDIGAYGADMFRDTESTVYANSTAQNRVTEKLTSFYEDVETVMSESWGKLTKEAMSGYVELAERWEKGEKKVEVQSADSKTADYLARLLREYPEQGKINLLNEKAEVTEGLSAVLYLAGITIAEGQRGVPRQIGKTLLEKGDPLTTVVIDITDYGFISEIFESFVGGGNMKLIQNIDMKKDSCIAAWLARAEEAQLNFQRTGGKVLQGENYLGVLDKIGTYANNNMYGLQHIYTLFGAYNVAVTGTEAGTKIGDIKITNKVADETAYWPGIYLGYMVDILKISKKDGVMTTQDFHSAYLPNTGVGVTGKELAEWGKAGTTGVAKNANLTIEDMQKDILRKVNGLMSEGSNEYRNKWLKSTLDGYVVTMHRAITGSWASGLATVSTGAGGSYKGVSGYVYTPKLEDIQLVDWVTEHYMQVYMLLMLLVLVVLILSMLVGERGVFQTVLLLGVMSVVLMLPYALLTNAVGFSNAFADKVYSERFDFWALTQHHQSKQSLKTQGVRSGDKADIIGQTIEKSSETYGNGAGVRVKWMSPKKVEVYKQLYTQGDMSKAFVVNMDIFRWLFSGFLYDSEFVADDPLATYLYRPYNSIAREGAEYYRIGDQQVGDTQPVASYIEEKGVTTEVEVYEEWAKMYSKGKEGESTPEYVGGMLSDSFYKHRNYANINYTAEQLESIAKVKYSKRNPVAMWGIGNEDVLTAMFSDIRKSRAGVTSNLSTTVTRVQDKAEGQLALYLKNTEGPYYYFYSVLKKRYGQKSFKKALLEPSNFKLMGTEKYATVGAEKHLKGKVIDYLGMEELFKYTIPYLSKGNEYVKGWLSLNDTTGLEYDYQAESIGGEYSEQYLEQKERKEEMNRVWNMYAPWVDKLTETARADKIRIAGKTKKITEALFEGSYLEKGRTMMYSEAEMLVKGYTLADMSKVESQMQTVLSKTYTDMQYLLNYYDLDDEVLLNAAAMYATFNFNQEFSKKSYVGESIMLYPQGLELKNFNYDAFMRLALLNATGENIFSSEDLYQRILDKTSIITGLLLITSDFLACILIPVVKMLLLILLFILGLLLSLTCVVIPKGSLLESIWQKILKPTVSFILMNIGFSYIVSLLIGEGLLNYVGSKNQALTTNDPRITLGLLILAGVVYVVVGKRLIKSVWYNMLEQLAEVKMEVSLLLKGVTKKAIKTTTGIQETSIQSQGVVQGSEKEYERVVQDKLTRLTARVSRNTQNRKRHKAYKVAKGALGVAGAGLVVGKVGVQTVSNTSKKLLGSWGQEKAGSTLEEEKQKIEATGEATENHKKVADKLRPRKQKVVRARQTKTGVEKERERTERQMKEEKK